MESLESLFMRAREIADPQARAACVHAACGDNAERARRVEALLADDAAAAAFFEQTKTGKLPALAGLLTSAQSMPEMIGPYRVLERLGGGGMGEVYRASQRLPVKREVAVKLIQKGLDSKHVMARFEAERQALALLSHPNIAKVYDAGLDDNERPYFVMEYVPGRPITEYADMQKLTVRERIELFCQVCEAVQHAHSKGIIHRDLKPTNILVFSLDGRPHVKIIDFGVAKATAQQLTESTLFTLHLEMVGTPAYMSPEQAECSPDIDTRSDIYSLGVLLYELLTGHTPHDSAVWRKAALHQLARIISETEPPKPSTRLDTLQEKKDAATTLETVARARSVLPQQLIREVRGELDWVVMKAMDKVPSRRYDTAKNFAEDVRHYIQGEPVQAVPPSTTYRFMKWMKRHRAAAVAGLCVVASLLVAVTGTTLGLVRERAASREARQQTEKAEDALYSAKIGLAQAALVGMRYPEMRQALADCSETRRGWEWQVLNKQANGGIIDMVQGYDTTFQFSPDGERLVMQSGYSLGVREAATGNELPAKFEAQGRLRSAHFIPGTSDMHVMTDQSLFRWDAVTGETSAPLIPGEISRVVMSENGLFVLAQIEDTARVYDTRTGQPVGPLIPIQKAKFSPSLCLLSSDGSRLLWGHSIDWTEPVAPPQAAAVDPFQVDPFSARPAQEDPLKPEGGRGGIFSLQLWDLHNGRLLRDSIRGPRLRDRFNFFFDRLLRPLKYNEPTETIEFSPDGKRLILCAKGYAQLWNAETGEPLRLSPSAFEVAGSSWSIVCNGPLTWSPDGAFLFSFCPDNGLYDEYLIWDLRTGNLHHSIRNSSKPIYTAFSPDSEYLLSLSNSPMGKIELVHLRSKKTHYLPVDLYADGISIDEHIPLEHYRSLYVFSPDARHLLAALTPKTSRVFDLATGKPVSSVIQHPTLPLNMGFTPDGSKVVVCSGHWRNDENHRMGPTSVGQVAVYSLGGCLEGCISHYVNVEEIEERANRLSISSAGHAVVNWRGSHALVDLSTLDNGVDYQRNDRLLAPEIQQRRKANATKHGRVLQANPEQIEVRSSLGGQLLWNQNLSGNSDTFATFSPDGDRVLTLQSSILRVHEANSGRSVCTFYSHVQPEVVHLPDQADTVEFWGGPECMRYDTRSFTDRQAYWRSQHAEEPLIHAEALRLLDIEELDNWYSIFDDFAGDELKTKLQRETANYPRGWLPRVLKEVQYLYDCSNLEIDMALTRVAPPTDPFAVSDPFAKTPPATEESKARIQKQIVLEIQNASSNYVRRKLKEAFKDSGE